MAAIAADPSPSTDPFDPAQTRVGWIGTGVMGTSMCGHLLDGGATVTVFSRTRVRAEPLVARGATWADTPTAVAAASDVVFTMVGTPADVRAVTLGADGVLAGLGSGAVLVDMTTSDPALALEIAEEARARSSDALDAPVSGGDIGARAGTLSIMVGGDPATFARVRPLLERMGDRIVLQGGPGAGQHTKAVNQTLVAGAMVAVCEALVYAVRAGLDLDRVLESVSGGAAASWTLSNLVPRMIGGDFAPGFRVEHLLKDLGIVLDEAARLGVPMPGTALARQLYVVAEQHGLGEEGTQALVLTISELAGGAWPGSSPVR
jgi:3-hydroxyisobutyrate dehydrogenase